MSAPIVVSGLSFRSEERRNAAFAMGTARTSGIDCVLKKHSSNVIPEPT